ncbi:hypothetical protein OROMI_020782 [Orobanche minor]
MNLVHSINSHVSKINARKGEEESREAARRCRLQKEDEINAIFDDSIASMINWLGILQQGYKVFGYRPEHHDPSVPWKQLVQAPPVIHLPTDQQPSPADIKQWRKNELMRYFVKLIRESTIFDRCKTLAEAANEFTARLEKGIYLCILPWSPNTGKVTRSPTQKTGFFHTTSRTKEWPFIKIEAKTLS